jgi:hypothetical protein
MRMRVSASRAPNGLVGQQQFGLAHQAAGQRHALLLAAGKLVRPGGLAPCQLHLGQRLPSAVERVPASQAEDDIVEDALPRQQPGILEDHRHALRHDQGAGSVGIVIQAGQCPKQGRLARPATPQEGHELATADRQIEPIENDARVEAPHQTAYLDGRRIAQFAKVRCHGSAILRRRRTALSAANPKTA